MKKQTFTADLSMLKDIEAFVQKGVEEFLSVRELKRIRLVCEEILMNIFNNAYPDRVGDITVCYEVDSVLKKIIISFTDRGVPFDPLSLPDPDLNIPVPERKVGGLGIFIVKKIMDEVVYSRVDGENRLLLGKFFR